MLHSHLETEAYITQIDEAFLLVKRHKISSTFRVTTEVKLQTKDMLFDVRRCEMKYYSIGGGQSDVAVQKE